MEKQDAQTGLFVEREEFNGIEKIILLRNGSGNICGYHNTTVFVNVYVMFMTGLQKEFRIRK